ncbi:MAG: hypothetical protein PF505_10920 [Vallitaleaceae bacterium]|jgi:chromosome segregation ATPase|nr:hypothetical protein [Vallitaleaceae bacterium]
MKRDNFVDLTALLDIILIILFAVMLNMNTTAESATGQVDNITQENDTLSKENNTLTEELLTTETNNTQLQSELEQLSESYEAQSETDQQVIDQYQKILEQLTDVLEADAKDISAILEQQDMTDSEQREALASLTDTNVLMENLHKYQVIAGTFEFIDLTFNLDTGMLLYNGKPTEIIISEDERLDDHLHQLKQKEIAEYLVNQIKTNGNNRSFILITIKFDPNAIKQFYIPLVSDSMDILRESYQEIIIIDTLFRIND